MKTKFQAVWLLVLVALSAPAFAQPSQVYPVNDLRQAAAYTGTASADNQLLFTATATLNYDACMLMSTTGAVDVEVTIDGTNWSTAALSLQDFGATTSDPVVVTAALRMYAINGKYLGIRVRQNGATATAATMLCWKR